MSAKQPAVQATQRNHPLLPIRYSEKTMHLSPRLLGILGLAALGAAPAYADAPALLPVQGYLTDADGMPLDGDIVFTFSLYHDASEAVPVFTEEQTISVDSGSFSAYIGQGSAGSGALDLHIFTESPDMWVGVAVAGDAELPRFQLATVPYAAHAEHAAWSDETDFAGDADMLGGIEASAYALLEDIPTAVGGLCGAGEAIVAINSDGTVNCASFGGGDITAVTAGSGLSGGATTGDAALAVDFGVTQARVSATCSAGQAIQSIDASGGVVCEDDDNTTYTAGSGLSLSGTTFSADTSALQARVSGTCAAGEAISAISASGTVTCQSVGAGTISEVAAGTGLSGGGTSGSVTLSIGADSVDVDRLTWGVPVQLPIPSNTATTSCAGSTLSGNAWGSTTSTSDMYIGNLFYYEQASYIGMRTDYKRARLVVSCRGDGVIELVDNCTTVLADISCSGGIRPWSATSDEFDPDGASGGAWNLRVRATSGTIEWANPMVVLY